MTLVQLLLCIIAVLVGSVIYLWITRRGERRVNTVSVPEGHTCPEASLQDPVTQLFNRKHLEQRLEEYMARCDRDNRTIGLVLWDIDGFVSFNNEFGQREGDRLLQKVGSSIRKAVRVYDEVFRAGPDEFCAIIVPSDPDTAAQVTERVRLIVSRELFEGNSEYAHRNFSLSYGYVFYPSDSRTPEALIYAANQALYSSRLAVQGRGVEGKV